MSDKIYITKKVIRNMETEELDFEIMEQFGDPNEDDFDIIEYGVSKADAAPIKISSMMEILTDLKEQGATHVEIEFHVDHQSYILSSSNIALSTKEEAEAYLSKKMSQTEKLSKIAELQKQIDQIRLG